MRKVSKEQHQAALNALAVYDEFARPYVQRNGWTVIPADVPRPVFNGEALTTDRINAYTTDAELYRLANEKPARFSAYVSNAATDVTTWTGERVGSLTFRGEWQRLRLYSFRAVEMRADFGGTYYGRETDSKGFVNWTRHKEKATRVLFRKEDDGTITAIFPDIIEGPGKVSCYAHLGQHSSCSRAWYHTTKPATVDEFAALKRELESAPFNYRLRVIHRWNHA